MDKETVINSINQLETALNEYQNNAIFDETMENLIEQIQKATFDIKLYLGYEQERYCGYEIELDEESMNRDGVDSVRLWEDIRKIAEKANCTERRKGVFVLNNKCAVDKGANMNSAATFQILLSPNKVFKKYVTKWIAKNGFYDDEDILQIIAELHAR